MPDEELKIRLTVAGQPQLNELIKKFNERNTTIAEEIKLRKQLDTLRKGTIAGTESEISLSKTLVTVKESLAKSSENVLTAQGKMMRQYFQLGTQLRSGLLPILDGLPASFRPVIGAIDNVTNRLSLMEQRGISKIDALKNAFTGGFGLVAGIGLAIAGLTLLIQKLNDTTSAQESLNTQMERFNRNLTRMTIGQAQGQLETEQTNLAQLVAAREAPRALGYMPGAGGMVAQGIAWLGDLFTSSPEELDLRIKAAQDRIKKLHEFIENEDQKLVDATIKREADVLEQLRQMELADINESRKMGLPSYMKGGAGLPGAHDHRKAFTPGAPISVEAAVAGIAKQKDMLQKPLRDMREMADLAGIIQTSLFQAGDSFAVKMFGALQIILKMMEAMKTAQLGGTSPVFGVLAGIFGLTGLLAFDKGGWINEPVAGLGLRSGRGYTFAENRPEYVSPGTASMLATSGVGQDFLAGEVRALRRDMANGRWRMRGFDMVYTTDRARNVIAQRNVNAVR